MKYEVLMTSHDSKYGCLSCLNIIYDGEIIQQRYDGGEPEDNSFGRDWNWVPEALRQAYELGLQDGRSET